MFAIGIYYRNLIVAVLWSSHFETTLQCLVWLLSELTLLLSVCKVIFPAS